jgi:hypothetical protein
MKESMERVTQADSIMALHHSNCNIIYPHLNDGIFISQPLAPMLVLSINIIGDSYVQHEPTPPPISA